MKRLIFMILILSFFIVLTSCMDYSVKNRSLLEHVDTYWQTEDKTICFYVYENDKAAGRIDVSGVSHLVYIEYHTWKKTYLVYSWDVLSEMKTEKYLCESWEIDLSQNDNYTLTIQESTFAHSSKEKTLIEVDKSKIHGVKDLDSVVNNKDDIDSLLKRQYDLNDLNKYFGTVDNYYFTASNLHSHYDNTFKLASVLFDIECLRKAEDRYYSIFNVQQGGYYYVFWEKAGVDNKDHVPEYIIYIRELKGTEDYESLIIGKSTAEDVYAVNNAFELHFMEFGRPYSYSLLDNGDFLKITYESRDELESRKDLVIEEMEVISKNEVYSDSYLAHVYEMDLKAYCKE